jgi:PAS domain S-box-containing protein
MTQRGTTNFAAAEASIEQIRHESGIFVEAVRATRMPMAVTDPTLQGNPIVFANESLLELTGYAADEVLGQQPFFMSGPDSDSHNELQFRGALERGEDIEAETVQYGKNGRRLTLSIFCRSLRDDHGRVVKHFFTYRDITRRVEAEAKLARYTEELEQRVEERTQALAREQAVLLESRERYRLIVEGARDYAIFTMDPAGKVTDWHQGAEAVFGWTRQEVLGKSADMTFTAEDREAGIPQWERDGAASDGSAPDIRWHIRKDGTSVFIEGSVTSLRTEHGELRGFLKIGQDMTERRAAHRRQETLLHELQHRVRNILATVCSLVVRTGRSSETIQDYRVRLEGRLLALTRTQAHVTSSVAAALDLRTLICDELDAETARWSQCTVDGPAVVLTPKAAEVVGVAVHELTTNAVRYGALSSLSGRVSVSWSVEQELSVPWLRLTWTENGVRTEATTRRGFGAELITARVPYELNGRCVLQIGETGASAIIEFPLQPAEISP